jgi:hypothetical protein
MSRIVRWEFMGSWLLFWALSISVLGIPLALLYLVNGTVRVEQDMEDAERFMDYLRAKRSGEPTNR